MYIKIGTLRILVFLFTAIGYPKLPNTSVPLFLFVIFLYRDILIKAFKSLILTKQFFIILIFGFYFVFRALIQNDFLNRELVFILTLIYKFSLGYLIAEIVFVCLNRAPNLIYFYLFIQLFLISFSAFNNELYSFLLLFQSSDAKEVFTETFGLRSMGFGIVHNEGVAFLVVLYSILIYTFKSNLLNTIYAPLIYLTVFSSRMGMFLAGLSQLLLSPRKLLFSIIIICILVFLLIDTTQGPFSEAFELLNNFNSTGDFNSKSTDAISNMEVFPDSTSTWLIGDGKFFSNDGFYMGTDIGFSRIVFFGGGFGFLIYVILTIYPLFLIDYKNRKLIFYLFVLNSILLFIITNVKGINVQNWMFLMIHLISKNSNNNYNKIK